MVRELSRLKANCLAITLLALSACSGSGAALSGGSPQIPQGPDSTTSSFLGGAQTDTGVRHGMSNTESSRGAGYDNMVLNDKAAAFYRLNDRGTQLIDTVTGQAAGAYGSAVRLGAAPLTSDEGTTGMFPGGSPSSTTEAVATPATQIQPVNAVSIEAWFEESTFQKGNIHLLAYGLNTTSHPYTLMINGDALEFGISPRNGGMGLYGPRVQPGIQYHIVGTYDGNTMSLYVNGQLAASTTTHGQFQYPKNGFSIGGSTQSGDSAFAGSVGDVAVYGYALSATQVANHYTTGAGLPMAPELPAKAQTFVDSIGINTHFSQAPYTGPGQQTIINLLKSSGIRHIREGMIGSVVSVVNKLASSGIRGTFITGLGMTDQTIESWPGLVPQSFEAYEGPNEPQYQKGDWDGHTRAFMQRLYSDVQNTPGLSQYPIIAPACPETSKLGNLSPYTSYGNMHDYFMTFNPGTAGWGNIYPQGAYGSLYYNMNVAREVTGSQPIMSTETGYDSTPGGNNSSILDNATAAKYITRTYFVHFNAGVPRTFVYEFLDENGSGQPFTVSGLVDLNLNPKPAYTALQAIISELSDSGPAFTPTPLTYQLTGNLANVQHMLLEKSDGSYYLALWLEVPSWSSAGGPFSVPSQSVTVVTQQPMRSATVMYLDNTGHATSRPVQGMPKNSGAIQVSDQISIIKMTP